MSMRDDIDDTDDDWTSDERQLLAALSRERIPPPELKARTLQAMRQQYGANARSRRSARRTIVLAAAAAVVFTAGTLVGYLAGRHSALPANNTQVVKSAAVARAQTASPTLLQVKYVIWY